VDRYLALRLPGAGHLVDGLRRYVIGAAPIVVRHLSFAVARPLTPEIRKRPLIIFSCKLTHSHWGDEFSHGAAVPKVWSGAFNEDRRMIEAQQQVIDLGRCRRHGLSCPFDLGPSYRFPPDDRGTSSKSESNSNAPPPLIGLDSITAENRCGRWKRKASLGLPRVGHTALSNYLLAGPLSACFCSMESVAGLFMRVSLTTAVVIALGFFAVEGRGRPRLWPGFGSGTDRSSGFWRPK